MIELRRLVTNYLSPTPGYEDVAGRAPMITAKHKVLQYRVLIVEELGTDWQDILEVEENDG